MADPVAPPQSAGSAHGEILFAACHAEQPPQDNVYEELPPHAMAFWARAAERYHAELRKHGVT